MVSPGLTYAALLNGLLLVLVLIVGLRYRSDLSRLLGTGPGVSTETWYHQTHELANEVERAADRTIIDSDELQRTLTPLMALLDGQLRRAPSAVDDDVYRLLNQLSNECRRIAMERADAIAVKRGDYIENELQTLESMAERLAEEADANR